MKIILTNFEENEPDVELVPWDGRFDMVGLEWTNGHSPNISLSTSELRAALDALATLEAEDRNERMEELKKLAIEGKV